MKEVDITVKLIALIGTRYVKLNRININDAIDSDRVLVEIFSDRDIPESFKDRISTVYYSNEDAIHDIIEKNYYTFK